MKENVINKTEKSRVNWIDIARGIAIIFVIVGHSLGNYFGSYLANLIYAFHMPIFFILSGYLFKKKKKFSFLKNSFFNLIFPYLATIVIELLLFVFYRVFPNAIIFPSRFQSIRQFAFAALYGVGNPTVISGTEFHIEAIGAIWFLLAFFIGNQLFNYIMSLKFYKHTLLHETALILAFSFMGIFLARYDVLPFSVNSALFSQVFFFTGYLLKRFNILNNINWKMIGMSVFLWGLSASVGLFGMSNVQFPDMFLGTIAGIASSIVVIKISMYLDNKLNHTVGKWLHNLIIFWGSQSLLIFCFHLIDLDFIQVWPKIITNLDAYVPYWVAILCGIIYRIVFASVCAYMVPHIIGLRSMYMHRQFPLLKNKQKTK